MGQERLKTDRIMEIINSEEQKKIVKKNIQCLREYKILC